MTSALGVSSAPALHHFSTKEKLVAPPRSRTPQSTTSPICAGWSAGVRRPCADCGPPRAGTPTGTAKGWRLWIEGWAAALREPALRVVARRLDRQWKGGITEVVAEGVAAGEFRRPDFGGTVLRPTALLDGLTVQLTSYGGAVSRTRARVWVGEAPGHELGLEREASTAPAR